MDIIKFKHKGNFNKTERFLKRNEHLDFRDILDQYCKAGVQALSDNTPVDSGLTSQSWSYNIEKTHSKIIISFNNTNVHKGVPIAIILQYGHGTGTGGWVEGRDYINPAIQPIFDKIADLAWKEVTR